MYKSGGGIEKDVFRIFEGKVRGASGAVLLWVTAVRRPILCYSRSCQFELELN